MEKQYSIGLDIGTASVGWAVVNEDLDIIRKSGKNLMGVRLFESGKTAVERRTHRATRRRYDRRRQRITLLQSLFEKEILNRDENFFRRLDNSFLWMDDKDLKTKNILFEDKDFDDKAFHDTYPTIYHLRKELVESDEKKDIRLIYLALHHMIKYRGHFINEGADFNTERGLLESVEMLLEEIEILYYDIAEIPSANQIISILLDPDKYKRDKKNEIVNLFDKNKKKQITEIVNAFAGYKADFSKVFDTEETGGDYKISFKADYDDAPIASIAGDHFHIFEIIEQVYSGFILTEILGDSKSISEAMVNKYHKHQKDLKKLKNIFRNTILKNHYKSMFKFNSKQPINPSYANYIKSDKSCSNESLRKELLRLFDVYKDELKDEPDVQYCLEELKKETFLQKLRSRENIGIPYQLNKNEMKIILQKQSKFYPFLGIDLDKILSILTFRIPYYVGPLVSSDKSEFAWMERIQEGKIYPWNYKEIIDLEKTAEKFIKRMTNKCTYLPEEDVIPKKSLLYSEFILLNELNKVKIGGLPLSADLKKDLLQKIFKVNKSVTTKKIKDFLIATDLPYSIDSTRSDKAFDYEGKITGTQQENKFASSLSSFIDFEKIFEQGYVDEHQRQIEQIIEWITIYNSKDIIQKQIENNFPEIKKDQINMILKKNYSGWSRLSAKLLDGIRSNSANNHGETVIQIMRTTNMNFMEILNSSVLGFKQQIDEIRLGSKKNSTKIGYEEIKSLPTSPANKRGIWQSVKIVEEIIQIMSKGLAPGSKNRPQRIYLEMAREDGVKGRTTSRRKKMEELYKSLRNNSYFDVGLINEVSKEDKLDSDHLYLYLTQNGKCMYSGSKLDIERLSHYHIDHIVPQSFIKDDSLSNRVLVCANINMEKADEPVCNRYGLDAKAYTLWQNLLNHQLISKKKFYNLMRQEFKEKDYKGFINRQLVETRQISKHVMNLFKDFEYTDSIVSVKAQLASVYRRKNNFYKIRNLNDLHHAHDAYLSCVIGSYIEERNLNHYNWRHYLKESTGTKGGFIIGGLNKNRALVEKVRKVLSYKNVLITKKLEENSGESKGGFWKATVKSKNAEGNNKIPLKNHLDPEKYGFTTSENKAYCVAVKYLKGKKYEYKMVGIPVQVAKLIKEKQTTLDSYLLKKLNYNDIAILKDKISIYQPFEQGGSKFLIASDSYLHTATQLFLDNRYIQMIYDMNSRYKVDDVDESILDDFYNHYISKLRLQFFKYERLASNLEKNRDKYILLSKIDKIAIINKLLDISKPGSSQIDLKKIGCAKKSGVISRYSFVPNEMVFLDQSVTGFYEKRYRL